MAENEDRDGKTEQPTARRLEKAREEGTVVRAHGVAAAAILVTGAATLSWGGARLVAQLELSLRLGLGAGPTAMRDPAELFAAAGRVVAPGCSFVAEFLALLAAAGLIADLLIGGWVFTTQPLMPDLSRISPAAGFRRLFSRAAGAEIVKALLKFTVVGGLAVWLLRGWAPAFARLVAESWPDAVGHAALLWCWVFLALTAALAAVAALEVPYQLWAHRDRLKMSRQEVRDEARDLEGSPQTKRRIKALRRRFARTRMMTEVPKADVVVVNPEHYAAALSYREDRMRAPVLVAKGTGLVALRIREIAGENGVPIVEAPRLARAICRYVELEDEIPTGLYPPVAEVLAYVYRLRRARDSGRPAPPPPRDRRFEPSDLFRV